MLAQMIVVAFALAAAPAAHCLRNGLALTPPMGWIAWERFTDTIDCQAYPDDCLQERLFKLMANRMVVDGYQKVGYKYINLDDCWSEKSRDALTSNLVADKARFPEGLRSLADYMHNRGLLFGIYGDCGTATCAGYPAQLKSEENLEDNYFKLDADQFAAWDIDSLKFDGCNLSENKQEQICPKMAQALGSNSRPMLLICEHPFYMLRKGLEPKWAIAAESCNTWRYFEDVEDSWLSVLNIIDFTVKMQNNIFIFHGPGGWFDPDQLVIGNFGLSYEQARAQMAIWCIWSAPLFMSNDLRSIAPEMAAILKNKQLIEVDQDPLGVFGLHVDEQLNGTVQAYVKPVLPASFGCPSFVVLYLNRGSLGTGRDVSFSLRELLTKIPRIVHMAMMRQGQLKTGRPIDRNQCNALLNRAMTKQRQPLAAPGLLVGPAGSTIQQPEVPLDEKQVKFKVVDLFGDSGAPNELALNSMLTLRVNPGGGVRVVKLTISEVK